VETGPYWFCVSQLALNVSVPGPPIATSVPAPQLIESLPPPPSTQSLPPAALIVFAAAVPSRRSAPAVPVTPLTTVVGASDEQLAGLSVAAEMAVVDRVAFDAGTVFEAPTATSVGKRPTPTATTRTTLETLMTAGRDPALRARARGRAGPRPSRRPRGRGAR